MAVLGGWVFLISQVPLCHFGRHVRRITSLMRNIHPTKRLRSWGVAALTGLSVGVYRGTSLIRKRTVLGPYHSLCLGSQGGPRGVGRFLMDEVPM